MSCSALKVSYLGEDSCNLAEDTRSLAEDSTLAEDNLAGDILGEEGSPEEDIQQEAGTRQQEDIQQEAGGRLVEDSHKDTSDLHESTAHHEIKMDCLPTKECADSDLTTAFLIL